MRSQIPVDWTVYFCIREFVCLYNGERAGHDGGEWAGCGREGKELTLLTAMTLLVACAALAAV